MSDWIKCHQSVHAAIIRAERERLLALLEEASKPSDGRLEPWGRASDYEILDHVRETLAKLRNETK